MPFSASQQAFQNIQEIFPKLFSEFAFFPKPFENVGPEQDFLATEKLWSYAIGNTNETKLISVLEWR